MQTLIQNHPLVNIETERTRVHGQLVETLTRYYLESNRAGEWEYLYNVWVEGWSDDRGIDLTGFPAPCDPAITVNEDAADWFTSIFTGIQMF